MPVEPAIADSVTAAMEPRRIGRRAFMVGAAAATLPIFALTGVLDRGRDGAATNQADPPASPQAATPAASPRAGASPFATLGATPEPVATIGRLRVFDDQRPAYSGQRVDGGALSLPIATADNSQFNPAAFGQDFQIMSSYLDPLIRIDDVSMEPRTGLATSWKVGDDGKSVTYALRTDVKWHDGTKFTARDVVFSFFVYRDDIASQVRNFFTTMSFAEAVDAYTVKVTLNGADGNWLLNPSSQLIFQRRQYTKFWEAQPEGQRTLNGFNWQKNAPLGTGPWTVGKRDPASVSFARNATYWGGSPHFETLRLAAEPDPAKRLQAWRSGEVDVVWPLAPNDVAAASDTAGRLYAVDAASVMFAAFNFANPARDHPDLLADLRIRQALSLAVDRARYAKEVFGGFIHEDRAGTVAQPWANNADAKNPARDLAKAKSLLGDAAWRDGNGDGLVENDTGSPLTLTLIVRDDARPELAATLQSIVADLKELGVTLDVQPLAADKFRDRWITTHDFDLIAYAYGLYPGFTDFDLYGSAWDIRSNPQGWNPGGYANPKVDKLVRDILAATDGAAQRDSLMSLQRAVDDDLFGLWFGFPRDLVLVNENVLGFQPNKLWQTWNTRSLWRATG